VPSTGRTPNELAYERAESGRTRGIFTSHLVKGLSGAARTCVAWCRTSERHRSPVVSLAPQEAMRRIAAVKDHQFVSRPALAHIVPQRGRADEAGTEAVIVVQTDGRRSHAHAGIGDDETSVAQVGRKHMWVILFFVY
jgi:hypothetical protein